MQFLSIIVCIHVLNKHTKALYFDSGEAYFRRVLEELKKTPWYIFMEFFILREGAMLNPTISLLEHKADKRARNAFQRIFPDVLRIFAPLM